LGTVYTNDCVDVPDAVPREEPAGSGFKRLSNINHNPFCVMASTVSSIPGGSLANQQRGISTSVFGQLAIGCCRAAGCALGVWIHQTTDHWGTLRTEKEKRRGQGREREREKENMRSMGCNETPPLVSSFPFPTRGMSRENPCPKTSFAIGGGAREMPQHKETDAQASAVAPIVQEMLAGADKAQKKKPSKKRRSGTSRRLRSRDAANEQENEGDGDQRGISQTHR
jgi:hypothetical protein